MRKLVPQITLLILFIIIINFADPIQIRGSVDQIKDQKPKTWLQDAAKEVEERVFNYENSRENKDSIINENGKDQDDAFCEDPDKYGPYQVSYVYDGDTYCVIIGGNETKVRLIGVDTPESVAREEYLKKSGKENTAEGKDASTYSKEYLTGKQVYLEYDVQTQDNYGRTLAYVWLEDGTLYEDVLLSKGLARLMTIQPNSKYADHFYEIEQKAIEEEAGFWGTGFFEE